MTALLHDLTPGEAVLWDAMTSFGWTPAQCRMAFAAAARGTIVTTRSVVPSMVGAFIGNGRRNTGLTRQSMGAWQRDMLLQRLGVEAAKLTRVTYDTDGEGGMVLEARLLVVPEVLTSSLD